MTLLSPWWLLLILPVALLAGFYVFQQRRRSQYAVRFASLPMLERLVPRRPGWRRHAPVVAMLFAFALLALAAARPEIDIRVPRERATVLVAIDVSLSMKATDVEPNRLDAAAGAATKFVKDLPAGFDVGLVTFAGTTSVLSPPTADREATVAALKDLTLSERTAIGEGVFTSLEQVKSMTPAKGDKPAPAHIVLLSDGTNTTGRTPEEAATAAKKADVPVSTIAYGTPNGFVEARGQMVPVPVDEATLAILANDTGGGKYTAESGDELDKVYGDIQSSIGFRTEPHEITPYVSALALLIGLLAAALSMRWFARFP